MHFCILIKLTCWVVVVVFLGGGVIIFVFHIHVRYISVLRFASLPFLLNFCNRVFKTAYILFYAILANNYHFQDLFLYLAHDSLVCFCKYQI